MGATTIESDEQVPTPVLMSCSRCADLQQRLELPCTRCEDLEKRCEDLETKQTEQALRRTSTPTNDTWKTCIDKIKSLLLEDGSKKLQKKYTMEGLASVYFSSNVRGAPPRTQDLQNKVDEMQLVFEKLQTALAEAS